MWTIYILRCSDDTYYTGVTTDMARRLKEHNELACGAKYTRARRPVQLVYQECVADRSIAQSREHTIRRLSRQDKVALIEAATS